MTDHGPDRYSGNGDQDWAHFKSMGASLGILKVTEGLSYDTAWYVRNVARARAAGLVVGHYHFLRAGESGADQWAYFASKFDARPGDIVPTVDYEGFGPGGVNEGVSASTGSANLKAFIAAGHAAGHEIMVYGHADLKAHFGDWRRTGADYYWVPGDSAHTDAGPPDLWQFGPYTHGPVLSDGGDWSVVLTHLPIIGGDKMTPEQEKALAEALQSARRFEAYLDGEQLARAGKPLPAPPGGEPKVISNARSAGHQGMLAALNNPKAGGGSPTKPFAATITPTH